MMSKILVIFLFALFITHTLAYLICANSEVTVRSSPEHLAKIKWIGSAGDKFQTIGDMGGAKGQWYNVKSISGSNSGEIGYAAVASFNSCFVPASDRKVSSYEPTGALAYASKWYSTANHKCSTTYDNCSPWSYWGEESCGYPSHGGDCADFVSQCLVDGGGHPYLNTGGTPCRGYPCGKEEIGAKNLGDCLSQNFNWNRTCDYQAGPPGYMVVGDVLIFHGASCSDQEAHATIITDFDNSGNPLISCHSPDTYSQPYTIFASNFGYFEWVHYTG